MLRLYPCFFVLAILGAVLSEVYFKEEFDSTWQSRWVESTHKGADAGKFVLSAGKYFNDAEKDKGLKTSQDAKFYDISAKFPKAFSNKGKTLVIQFQIKHEQGIDCGGGYIKVLGSNFEQSDFHGETPYNVMFGPDICGPTKKVHVIFSNNGENHLITKEISCKDDEYSHVYTLVIKPDNTYEVRIDLEKVESGSLEDDWKIVKPKKIPDPNAKKPTDWVDEDKIDDPKDTKPEDWDKPKTIPDPKAKKPDDWDDEMDGEWEPAQIDNPDYKGEWKAKQIDNPAYKGPWIHPEIDNPDYVANDALYAYDDFGGVGIDLWQVKSGSIFDNIIFTDDLSTAETFAKEQWKPLFESEKKQKEAADAEEAKKREEEEKKRKEEEDAKKKAEGGDEKKKPAEEDTPAGEKKEEEKDEL